MNAAENTKNLPDLQCLPSLCRGLYNRVAQKLGCDPSYVSRVARGERSSKAVSEALRAEIQQTWAMANIGFENGSGKKANGANGKSAASRKALISS
jgi:hypothetical protein